jgi:hypothetical protein
MLKDTAKTGSYQQPPETDKPNAVPPKVVIDRLMDFSNERIKEVLKQYDLRATGTKSDLRYVVEQAVLHKVISIDKIADHIFEWEPWSHRHAYFLRCDRKLTEKFLDEKVLKQCLQEAKLSDKYNAKQFYTVPLQFQIDRIALENGKLTIIFVSPVYSLERRPYEDKEDEDTGMVFQASQKKKTRKAYYVDINLKTGMCFMSIPSINRERGRTYKKERAVLEKAVGGLLGIKNFELVTIDTAIGNLMQDPELISNSLLVQFATGHRAQVKSPDKKQAVFGHKTLEPLEKVMSKAQETEGAFYNTDDDLKPNFRFKIYEDQRLGIFSDTDRKEFQDVVKLVLSNS